MKKISYNIILWKFYSKYNKNYIIFNIRVHTHTCMYVYKHKLIPQQLIVNKLLYTPEQN